jgi:hypothetical protein
MAIAKVETYEGLLEGTYCGYANRGLIKISPFSSLNVKELSPHRVIGYSQQDILIPDQSDVYAEKGNAEGVIVGAVQRIDNPGVIVDRG